MNKLIIPANLLVVETKEPDDKSLYYSVSFYRFNPEVEQWWKEQSTTTIPRIRTELHESKQFVFHWVEAETLELANAFKLVWY